MVIVHKPLSYLEWTQDYAGELRVAFQTISNLEHLNFNDGIYFDDLSSSVSELVQIIRARFEQYSPDL